MKERERERIDQIHSIWTLTLPRYKFAPELHSSAFTT